MRNRAPTSNMGRKKKDPSISDLSRGARSSLARTIDEVAWQLQRIQDTLRVQLDSPQIDFRMIQSLEVSQGILIDKQTAVLRQLKDLENSATEELEAAFEVWEEMSDGTRVLRSKRR